MSDRIGELEREPSDGLAELYRRHSAWLARRMRRRFGDDGDDIAHETWRRVLAAYGDGDGVRHPRALLLKVSARLGAGWTARGVRREALIEAADWAQNGATEGGQETSVLLEQLILGLPDEVRNVFVMSRFGGLTNVQIAERLGIRPKTVEWRMTKALAQLAAQLRR